MPALLVSFRDKVSALVVSLTMEEWSSSPISSLILGGRRKKNMYWKRFELVSPLGHRVDISASNSLGRNHHPLSTSPSTAAKLAWQC